MTVAVSKLRAALAAFVLLTGIFVAPVTRVAADPIICGPTLGNAGNIQQSLGTTAQIVAAVAGKSVYVCNYVLTTLTGGAATTAQFVSGTGSNCATGQVNLTGQLVIPTSSSVSESGNGAIIQTAAGTALCITSGSGGAIAGHVTFIQF